MSNEQSIRNAHKLLQDLEKKIRNWNERSQFRLKGVGNLSRADLDQIALYAQTYINNGGNFYGLMEPMGDLKKILDAYGLKQSNSFGW